MDQPSFSEHQKLTIILRGPPATGKSTVAEAICASASTRGHSAKVVNLDQGWLAHERPSRHGGPERYPELVSCKEDLLVVELAQGEPSLLGVAGEGATHNPLEWLSLIMPERQVFSFLLWADWDQLSARLRGRGEVALVFFERCFRLHQSDPIFHDFAIRAGIPEQRILVSDKTPNEICELIVEAVCLARVGANGRLQ